jgi:hypothetical protein
MTGGIPNPFSSDVVASPEQAVGADVAQIHRAAFDACRSAYERVAKQGQSHSVLLFGEAGCGKTHLLGRFRKWLAGEQETAPSISPALFVAVRVETAPSQVWRHLRRRLAEEMTTRKADGDFPLDRALLRFAGLNGGNLAEALDERPVKDLDLNLMRVLEHFALGEHRRLCRAWLVGDGLLDEDLRTLRLSPIGPEDVEEDYAETSARRVVLALIRLCSPRPVVLCFDQLEALDIVQQAKSFALFDRMGASLVDETGNALLVSTVLAAFLGKLEGDSPTDFVRIAKEQAHLHSLDWEQSKALVSARLSLVPELAGKTPIPESSLRTFFDSQHGSCNPRRLIHHARQLFAEWQQQRGETAPSEAEERPSATMDDFLRDELDRLWAGAQVDTGADADKVLAHGLPVALHVLGHMTEETASGLIAGSGNARVQVALANQRDMRSLAPWLKKLLANPHPGTKLCVLRDARLTIPSKAIRTRERLEQIVRDGGRVIRVEAEALAALDAMRRLVSAATSGDLSRNGDTVEPKTVREWLARNLPGQLAKLAEEVLCQAPAVAADPRKEALFDLIAKMKVFPAGEAARETGCTLEQLEDYARAYPLYLRWFGGPCPVLCQAVVQAPAGDANDAR